MIIGLDVGGTHTDVVLLGPEGVLARTKEVTDQENLVDTVLRGVDGVLGDIDPGKITRVVLSTTLTTNSVIRNTLTPVGMVVAAGPGMDPELHAIGPSFHVVKGALDHRGAEIAALDKEAVKKAFALIREKGIRAIGLVTKFSVRNPSHEEVIEKAAKGLFDTVFCGHRLSGVLNFPRRIASCWLNAGVHDAFSSFSKAVKEAFQARGIIAPVHVLKADGGTFSLDAALECPGETVLSGPSASVMGAIPHAPSAKDVLVLDIGGTTTDMAVLIDKVPVLEPLGAEVGGVKTLFRALKSVSIGLGGDSELKLKGKELLIGPDRKGPALCLGGPVPTPTDAMAVLGFFEGGDRAAALKGMETLGRDLGMETEAVSRFVLKSLCEKIRDAAFSMVDGINARPVYTLHEMLEGYVVKPEALLVMGGPAAVLAPGLGEACGLESSAVPDWGVANAIGAALARTTCAVTVLADTQRGFVRAPEEGYSAEAPIAFNMDDAIALAKKLVREKALRLGADVKGLEVEVLEAQEFSMMRGYRRAGRNIRVRAQVKPGLIRNGGIV
ncbi:hydantoinase/oxoprolinase family protein [Desulfobotulus mexicanus]|uniref:Hydantoinase/oxoprolinase family protein n=1 Tax=Desulfobotulus mexicanus TaxID=2586642 RepID=A0A5Q4VDE8_9BACT|nr:hydantoinase/oxoprolinase family protein [Desulfobotulus mexicanus]TYT74978.1 hydantoinase/oxoprolinase family protein [Desulfobotulus mexicanus]